MHPLYRILDSTITGRLRSRLAREWSGSDEIFPSNRTIWLKIMKLWRENSHFARLHFHVFNAPPLQRANMDRHLSRHEVNEILRDLADHPPVHRLLGEGRIDTVSDASWACLVMGHEHPSGVAGYYAFIFQDDCLERGRIAHVSIVPPSASSPSRMEFQGPGGWELVSPRHINKYPPIRAALLLLQDELQPPPNTWLPGLEHRSEVPLSSKDAEYMRLITLALKNELDVTHAIVSMKDVIPHDIGHLRYSDKWVNLPLKDDDRMVVFWREDKFVMCDDYAVYCQHISKGSDKASVAILGKYPSDRVHVERVGRKKLIPQPRVSKGSPQPLLASEQDAAWLAHNKIRAQSEKHIDRDMMAIWLSFAELVADSKANEGHLHDFILKRPVIISEFGDHVISEVSLDGKYFVDLLARRQGMMPKVWLIELEQANHRIITQGGQETKEVTHAVQQVNDWLRWWRSRSDHPLVKESADVEPRGVVIIGRSSQLTAEDRIKLAHNNQGRNVEVITYDELLDKFGDFILSQVSDKPSFG